MRGIERELDLLAGLHAGARGESRDERGAFDVDDDVPALALTGYASEKDAKAALEAGFDVHIPKPVDPGELTAKVEELLCQRPSR